MITKILLSILAFGLIVSAYSQKGTIELAFAAENNGQYIPLDSIFIENLTQGGDTTLYAPDTGLVLAYVTNISNNLFNAKNTLLISQNYPNPFKKKTEVNLYLSEKDDIKITISDILGRELTHYENTLRRGKHSFAFYSGIEKYYLLTVTGKQTSKTIKMLNASNNTANGERCKIVYGEYENSMNDFKSHCLRRVAPTLAEKAINNFVFSIGDELRYSAFTDVEVVEMSDSPLNSKIYIFQFEGWTSCPGISTVTDIDGNIYNTVQIGTQCLMKENLKTTTYQNGASIPNVTEGNAWSNLTTGAYVWYSNNVSWKDLYGALYNWHATVDPNGLCPTGWHTPTDDEWTELTDFIGGTVSPHGNELKSCRQVNSPQGGKCNTIKHPRWYENGNNGTDDYGFSGLPGGYRYSNGMIGTIGNSSNWWSFTDSSSSNAWARSLSYNNGNIDTNDSNKRSGLSVRCFRD